MFARYFALISIVAAVFASLLIFRQPEAQSEGSAPAYQPNFTFPQDYRDDLVLYATVDRSDNISRDIYITPGAAEIVANNSTARLPFGTVIAIDAHHIRRGSNSEQRRTGLADTIHLAVKQDDWQDSDYATVERVGTWNYFAFDPETEAFVAEGIRDCFDCHANNSHIDFIFTRDLLGDFGATEEQQFSFCNRPDRFPCNF